ncbi:MAG: GNAT family N-acetyltransferase [Verrucomicrobia bacterium]|nr:GNAT family N-acetyltransferase [Verrucomicrobiota bacterium]
MLIRPLADDPGQLELLAGWFHSEWHGFDHRSMEEVRAQLAENLNRGAVPITFLAYRGPEVVGAVSLDVSDLPSFDHLSPWLASLYVRPDARGAGIGSALVQHVQRFALSRGLVPLHLWTPGSTELYERCGWVTAERATHRSRPITIMRFS